ncbi:MAG: hypothetical protein KA896_05455 [Leptothrix sp. (in: Bacteria)]|nr:hypothetical protein [Leptothrix sp. (in: b-proteobacteria)]MBP7519871.1 hypothetical protein [Leptothrix sp. (in: b-proteobacteria)]HQY08188.1 hypothetical protein [Burkholderiaceae bacterium]
MNASNPAPSPIDLEVLLALTEGDEALADEFLADFRLTASQAWEEMHLASRRPHFAGLRHAAQRIQAAAHFIGADALGHSAEAIDHAAAAAQPELCRLLVDQWHAQWRCVDDCIAERLANHEQTMF